MIAATVEREPTQSAAVLRPYIETAREGGVDVEGILSAHDLTAEELKADTRLPIRVALSIGAALDAAYDGPLGIRSAARVAFRQFGLVDHLISAASTLREALELANRFLPLAHEGISLVLHDEGDGDCHIRVIRSGYAPRPAGVEFVFGVALRVMWALLGREHPPIEVRFAHPGRAPLEEYTTFFRAPVVFDAVASEFVFARGYLDLPLSGANVVVRNALGAVASEREAALTATALVKRVKVCATVALEQRRGPLLAEVARAMGLGPRTLQRRLLERGTTFDGVLDELRHELALDLVANPNLPIAHVANRLGFDASGAFTRAFRRWTSMSPSEFRATKSAPSTQSPGQEPGDHSNSSSADEGESGRSKR